MVGISLATWRARGYQLPRAGQRAMTTKAREFIDFWIENSVHAREYYGMPGAEQRVAQLVRRLIEAARAQGISEKAMTAEVGQNLGF
jgi:hypothetical protein